VSEAEPPPAVLERAAAAAGGLAGAARCALELALLDAAGRHLGCGVGRWLGPTRADVLVYDAVIPFSGRRRVAAIALAIRLLGIRRVKVKVGRELAEDLHTLRMLRRLLGGEADLRVDANCAWTVEQALHAIERMRPFRLSVVEQPVAAADLDGLRRLRTECEPAIAVDESLRTAEEARALVEAGACDAFNIRVSKCGGLLASLRIAEIAERAGMFCIVGAQVGESGILSAAGRHLAAAIAPRYLEGSAGPLLLRKDLTEERILPGWGGRARPFVGPGLGVHVRESLLGRAAQVRRVLESGGLTWTEEVAT
jgi:muconate cycloisomerase